MSKPTCAHLFTEAQHTTLIVALIQLAYMSADPSLALETLRVVSPKAADVTERKLAEGVRA